MRGSAAAARHAWLARLALALAGAAALPVPAFAQGAQATLVVRATVAQHTSMQIVQPATLVLSASDIAHGSVDIAVPLRIAVRSNVHEGYVLVLERLGGQVSTIQVQIAGVLLQVGASGARVARPAAGPGMWTDIVQLHLRFELSADAVAGEHPWPMQVSLLSQ